MKKNKRCREGYKEKQNMKVNKTVKKKIKTTSKKKKQCKIKKVRK